jgi:two-component system nitrogen regulation response regulator NtrX
VSARKGRFELASGGTLFLDEIGDMSVTAQAKVLRAIQEQRIERVGGERPIDVDVRIVAATNKDLEKECAEGRFRQDLFFRLNVIPINIPPLRERPDDVSLFLFHFLKNLAAEGCGSADGIEFDEEALQELHAYPWPGNVRELRNLAERVLVMHQGKTIGKADVAELLQKNPGSRQPDDKDLSADLPADILDLSYLEAKETFEKRYLAFQLERNGGIITRTAEAIGMYPGNLHAKLRKYKLSLSKG